MTGALVATDHEGLEALAPAWRELETSAEPNVFLTFDWVGSYWRTLGRAHQPYVIAIADDDGELVGLAPFERRYRRLTSRPTVRLATLRLPCDREREGFEYLSRRGHADGVADAVAAYLRAHRADWHILEMTDVPLESPAVRALRQAFGRDPIDGLTLTAKPATPYVRVESDWATYIQTLAPRDRKELRSVRHRLEGDLGARLRSCRTATEVHGALAFLFEHKNARLRKMGIVSVYERPRVQVFMLEACDRLLESQRLECTVIEIAGKTVAASVAFRMAGRAWAFNSAYDERWQALGLGRRMLEYTLQRAFETGAEIIGLGQGNTGYKWRYTRDEYSNVDVRIGRRWALAAEGLVTVLRNLWQVARRRPRDASEDRGPQP